MFRVHTPIIRSIRRWIAAYGRSCVRCGFCRATARQHPHRTHDLTTYTAALTTTTHPKTRCRKPYAATQSLMLLMMCLLPETCRAKNTLIKLPCCIKLAFQIISWGRCTVKQPSLDTISDTELCQNRRVLSGFFVQLPAFHSCGPNSIFGQSF